MSASLPPHNRGYLLRSAQLARMCTRGLVQRQRGEGRAIHPAITGAGLAALQAAVPRHTEHVRHLVVDRLTPRQIDPLAESSRTILAGLDAP